MHGQRNGLVDQCRARGSGATRAGLADGGEGDAGTFGRGQPPRKWCDHDYAVAICRLFALHAGTDDVEATFWLLDAPASLAEQSHANPDGFGLATLSSAAEFELVIRPALAAEDDAFAHQARSVRAAQFLAHVRYADTGRVSLANTHPFIADGRVFAHNGVLGDLDEIDRQLGQDRDLVAGQTDSERLFALLTVAIWQAEGDVRRGIIDAVSGVVARYELYAINFLLGTPGPVSSGLSATPSTISSFS